MFHNKLNLTAWKPQIVSLCSKKSTDINYPWTIKWPVYRVELTWWLRSKYSERQDFWVLCVKCSTIFIFENPNLPPCIECNMLPPIQHNVLQYREMSHSCRRIGILLAVQIHFLSPIAGVNINSPHTFGKGGKAKGLGCLQIACYCTSLNYSLWLHEALIAHRVAIAWV